MRERSYDTYYLCRNFKLRYALNLFLIEWLLKRRYFLIYYINPNRSSGFIEKLIRWFPFLPQKGFSVMHLDCDVSKMRNENGIPIIKASGCDDLYEIINELDKNMDKERPLFDCLNSGLKSLEKDLKLYIKNQIALGIFSDLFMANVTHWLGTNRESNFYGKDITLIFERKNYWSNMLLNYMKNKHVKFEIFRNLNLRRNNKVIFLYYIARLCLELLRSILKGKIMPGASAPKVGVPFYAFQNFTEYYDLKNYYLFWFPDSGIPPENILIYLDEPKFALSDEEVKMIRNAGFGLVYCPKKILTKAKYGVPVHICSFKTTLSLTVQYLKLIAQMHKLAKGRFTKEVWKILASLFIQFPYWEDFFKSNNIKVKFRFHDIFSARDIAAKLAGATTLSYHYSSHTDSRITREEVCDVFFIWGNRYKKVLSPDISTTRFMIETGYIFDYTFDNLKRKANELRNALKQSNVSYKIGILDENITKSINYFTESVIRLYKAVLEYAVSHPEVGIIIKPKREITTEYLRTFCETSELLLKLETQKRILILDSLKYPVEAGFASDLVIGVIPDSTAGLECALAGIPMVVYDCTSRGDSHPLYKSGHNRIIFDDIRCLIEAININKEKPGSLAGFADWSDVLNLTDPFRDGKANYRVASYIRTLLLRSSNGTKKEDAIMAANELYMANFGIQRSKALN